MAQDFVWVFVWTLALVMLILRVVLQQSRLYDLWIVSFFGQFFNCIFYSVECWDD
jgi:hypothetical protein